MIRVNLFNDVGGGVQAFNVDATEFAGEIGEPDKKDAGTKLGLMLIPVFLVYGYFSFQEWRRDDRIQEIRNQIATKKSKVNALQPEIRAIERFQEEKKKLEIQVEAIKKLSFERLLSVKALDALQRLIPQKVWLKTLEVNDTEVRITGLALEDALVSDFMQNLNSSIFFQNTMLLKTTEAKDKDGLSAKEFEVSSELVMGTQ